jgi:hypothetical protein
MAGLPLEPSGATLGRLARPAPELARRALPRITPLAMKHLTESLTAASLPAVAFAGAALLLSGCSASETASKSSEPAASGQAVLADHSEAGHSTAAGASESAGEPRQAEVDPGSPAPASTAKLVSGGDLAWAPKKLDFGASLSGLKLSADAPAATTVAGAPSVQAPVDANAPADTGPAGTFTVEGSASHDFGEVVQGAVLEHVFTVTNTGEADLIVNSAKGSCSCTVAENEIVLADGSTEPYQYGQPIAPGGKLLMKAQIDTAGKKARFNGNLTVFSNDPLQPSQLRMTADIKPFFELQPGAYLDFGQVRVDEQNERRMTITSPLAERFGLEVSMVNQPDYLSFELIPQEPDDAGRASTWELVATLGPDAAEAPAQNWPMMLKSDVPLPGSPVGVDGEVKVQEVRVFTVAQILGLVRAMPHYMSFGVMAPGQTKDITVRVEVLDEEWSFDGVPVASIRGRTPKENELFENHATVTLEPVEGGQIFELTCSLTMPEDYPGPFGGFIDVAINHPTKETLSVMLSGVSRAVVNTPTQTPGPPSSPIGSNGGSK